MLSAFIIALREGLEIALILSIILSYLNENKLTNHKKYIYIGFILAVITSIFLSITLNIIGLSLTGFLEEIYEGITSLTAAFILTTVIIWMHQKSSQIKIDIENRIEKSLQVKSNISLIMLSFTIVIREGVEIVLFLQESLIITSLIDTLLGAIIGFSLSVLTGLIILKSSIKINTKKFFKITSIILLIMAAGMLAIGINELQEAGIIPTIIEHVYDISYILDENSTLGSILKTLLGYNSNPSLIELSSYLVFLITIILYFKKSSNYNHQLILERIM
ncbi:MAG: FTR1 family iron permease [Candidatus Odinarchaeia archaeon]